MEWACKRLCSSGLLVLRTKIQTINSNILRATPIHTSSGGNSFSTGLLKKLKVGGLLLSISVSASLYIYAKFKRPQHNDILVEIHKDSNYRGLFSKLLKVHNVWLIEELAKHKFLEEIASFPVYKDDVFVVSFPKSGTTWVQEVAYLIQTRLDVESAMTVSIEDRVPFLEYIHPGIKSIRKQPSPRIIKTHMPYHLLPKDLRNGKGKIIYIARDPRDVIVSNYHFAKMVSYINYQGSFEEFYSAFVDGKVNFGPWEDHVLAFWDRKKSQNLLFITYEEMHKDVIGVVKKIVKFMGKDTSDSDCHQIASHCSFQSMKSNPKCNYKWLNQDGNMKNSHFMRKGVVGDWKNHFTEAMEKNMQTKYREKLLEHELDILNLR